MRNILSTLIMLCIYVVVFGPFPANASSPGPGVEGTASLSPAGITAPLLVAAPPPPAALANHGLVPRLMSFMEFGIDWVLWLLFALGAGCLFILVERTVYFSLHTRRLSQAPAQLCEYLSSADLSDAQAHYQSRGDLIGRVLSEALANRDSAPEALAEMVDARLMLERQRLERGLNFVATVGSNAPFIGLFGTVLGIIKAFHDLATAEHAGPAIVMAGISEALVATAVGLLVAIPAVVIFNIFKARTRSVLTSAESVFKLFLSRQLDLCLRPPSVNSAPTEPKRVGAVSR